MPIDPRAKRLLDMLALSDAKIETATQRRDSFAKLMAVADSKGPEITVENLNTLDLPLRVYRPDQKASAALVFFHGGGLVAGSLETHDGLCRRLATASGVNVIAVDYRLAPEARFPTQFDDAIKAVKWVHAHTHQLGLDASKLGIGGESVGALLAVLASSSEELKPIKIKAQLLLCPVVDLAFNGGSRERLAKGYMIDAETIAGDVAHCLGDTGTVNDLPSPLRLTNIAQLPATIIHAAEFDPFHDEAKALAAHLANHGADVLFHSHAGMIHSFYALTAFIPQGATAIDGIGKELAKALA
jgi:acetyl esterase/lipase